MARRRRRAEGLNPFVAAGLIKFSEEGEMEKIKLKPITITVISIGFAIAVFLLRFLIPI